MDLHSRHPSIVEQDFLLMDEHLHRGKWDIISLSLVLNFVPEPKDRGGLSRFGMPFILNFHVLQVAYCVLPIPC
jgi:25S rRNA (adenine2142-N1)-methyltransferase